MKNYNHKSILVLLFLLFLSVSIRGQNIILNEEFTNNQNGWRVIQSKSEVAKVISGQYRIQNYIKFFPEKPQLFYTIKKEHNFQDFSFEAVIINKERVEVYEIFDLNSALSRLNSQSYKKKDYNKIRESLIQANYIQIAGGRFHWDFVKNNTGITNYNRPFEWEPYSDGVSFLHYNKDLITRGVQFGLVFGKNGNTYYEFGVYPDLKAFWVLSTINGNETTLREPTISSLIKEGVDARNNTNKLGVSRKDGFYIFYINNQEVTRLKDEYFKLAGDEIGFYLGSESYVWIESAKIQGGSSSSSSRQPTPPSSSSGYASSGSGFFISNKGYIVTNYHVIEDARVVDIETKINGVSKISRAKIIVSDKNNDLAILKIDGFYGIPQPVYGFNPSTIDVGTSVYAMGYPLLGYMGDEVKITDGIISSKTGFQGDISLYQISAPIQPGNSGGALFDKKGNLVGITNAGIPDAQNVGYAIKASYLKNLIELLPERVVLNSDSRISSLSFTEQIKRLQECIVIVKVKE